MNRQQRRSHLHNPSPATAERPALCVPGAHALGPIEGTVDGKTMGRLVFCSTCRRTFQEILDEDPGYAAMYRAWVDAGEPDHWPPDPGQRP